ncbi:MULTISPECIES: hypothetical protein [unclassified Photobacterium]|uniref:hypothetical protein n=1 Tax=unclassified Photobacterium TaxID=2628852 RepID=UPI000D16AC30|nr:MULTISPECIES: hypothetical protein [unclassified Photobacterium]PSV26027.1 hypothetical protein C9J42_13675 [Photobacterium sp. GB-56]PSV36939.1 hypothetical protein C9J44_09090 [Photobacterium sp. GB-27]PSV44011.1 hypothetical protein C9J46_10715 [Photobacterium sp. GB-36]PSV52612.1 hypothetical protein C9J45_10570 [Photobacterium sp. GB-1]PSW72855.1 hypothetical protein C9J41_14430 [Photobacterium sp. GB-50]
MTRLLLGMIVLLGIQPVFASEFDDFEPTYNRNKEQSSGWFLSSQSRHQQAFDVWQIDSGYAYTITKNTQLYLSTQLTSGTVTQRGSRGIASGVKYNLTPKVSLQSEINTATTKENTKLGIEVSSQYDVSDQLNLRATVDYEELEQVIEFGLGFSF